MSPARRSSVRRAAPPRVGVAGVVLVGRLASAVLAEGSVDLGDSVMRLASTVAVGVLLLPAFVALDRALVRRRLG